MDRIPPKYITGIPTNTVTIKYRSISFLLPFSKLISHAAAIIPITYPPDGPKILLNPFIPPEKTGSPIIPIKKYNIIPISVSIGFNVSAITLTTTVCIVIADGEKGTGIGGGKYAVAHIKEINIEIFVILAVFTVNYSPF
jgi:hypothetical protein